MTEFELTRESPEAPIALFAKRGWGDGLPLVVPTKDRADGVVAGCSAGSGKSSDE